MQLFMSEIKNLYVNMRRELKLPPLVAIQELCVLLQITIFFLATVRINLILFFPKKIQFYF